MKNTNKIYHLPKTQSLLDELSELERDRIYCRHDLSHLLSVGRIGYILSLENNLKLDKDLIYTTALLHDLGRGKEYQTGRSHDKISGELAKELLQVTDFTQQDKTEIIDAIENHRGYAPDRKIENLSDIISIADNLSRDCFNCKTQESCKWHQDRKNLKIKY